MLLSAWQLTTYKHPTFTTRDQSQSTQVVIILNASSNSLFDNSWAIPHTTTGVYLTPIYDQLQSAIIRNDQHDQLLSASANHSKRSYDQSDGSPLPPSRPGPLAYYWTLLSNPPVLYKFQQPPCCLLGAAPLVNYTTIQLSKCPTTQILNYLLFKWGPNNILRLLKQAHYTFNGMWVGETNYQNIQQPNCFTIHYGDPTLSSSN